MKQNQLTDQLKDGIDPANIVEQEPMSKHTTFRIGGPADYFIMPADRAELIYAVACCREHRVPYYIMGNGSNLLVGDKGYRGAVIQFGKSMNTITVTGTRVTAGGGAVLSRIAGEALANELKGFEFAAGIPGTIGGAAVMNAGAYGGEMKDVICEMTVLDQMGTVKILKKEEMAFGYRTSIIAKTSYIVMDVTIQLEQGEKERIRAEMETLKEKRIGKQPLEFPSAGSTFKRPEGYYAGKLIQDAGLGGYQVGGAAISDKHCGFVINKDHATAADVVELMKQVTDIVKAKFGVTLEPEVKKIGEF